MSCICATAAFLSSGFDAIFILLLGNIVYTSKTQSVIKGIYNFKINLTGNKKHSHVPVPLKSTVLQYRH